MTYMGGEQVPRVKRSVMLTVRTTPGAAQRIDELRGDWSRSDWLRRAMEEAVRRKLGPGRSER